MPERLVSSLRMEEVSDLVDVSGAHVAAQQVAQQMKCRVSQPVGRVQHRQSLLVDAALPKIAGAGSFETFRDRVPELKMEIDAAGISRIEQVAFPPPAGLTDQRRSMIGG